MIVLSNMKKLYCYINYDNFNNYSEYNYFFNLLIIYMVIKLKKKMLKTKDFQAMCHYY